MTFLSRFSKIALLAVWFFGFVPGARASALSYLQMVSDMFQQTIDVYTDADAAGNHFAARGEFDNLSMGLVPAMDEISVNAQCLGITCLTATFNPSQTVWGGWYFMNGILGPTDREPTPNWGTVSGAGYNAAGATELRFMARGANGGEKVLFFCCGVGFDPNTGLQLVPYPDSSPRVATSLITLTTTWTQYSIPLSGDGLQYVLGGFGWVAVAGDQPGQEPITFYLDNIQYVKPRPGDPRLLVSYVTTKSTNEFDAVERNAAFVYDNSVALISMLGLGDAAHAQTIADALIYAQANDRFFTDGRVRNAYQGGDISLPPGWVPNNRTDTARMPGWYDPTHSTWYEDETQVSSNTGNVAWAALALLDMWETTKSSKYLTAAQALGNWVISNTSEQRSGAAGSLGGFTGGYDGWENGAAAAVAAGCASGVLVNGQCKRLYKSTEHNIDLYAVFTRLFLADGTAKWATAAQQAKHFFLSNWDPQEGKFWTGTEEDGATISTDVIPVDIQAWSILALGSESQPYWGALNYVEANHKTSLGYGFKQDGGNSCGDYTWFEGTSQVALAYLLAGNQSKWQSILNNVYSVQGSTGGVPATDGPCLNTGFTLDDGSPWEYFPRIHVGATGWLSLAENSINPYKGGAYSPQLSAQTLSFSVQSTGTTGAAQTVTLSNPGALPLSIQSVTLTGTNAQDFGQTNTCGTNLAAGRSCVLSVAFSPTAAGTRSAVLTITEISDPAMAPVTFTVALSGSGVVAAAPLPQTISFGPLSNQILGAAPFNLNATSSSGLVVTFASNTPSVCTVSGVTVTLVAVGTCSITARQAGNSNYAAAAPVTQSFTVNAVSQTNIITWTLQNVTFAKGENVSGWFQVDTSVPEIYAWNLTFGGLPSYDPTSEVCTEVELIANVGCGATGGVGFDDLYSGGITASAYPEGNGTGNPFVFIFLNGPSIPLYAVGNYVDPLIANVSESSISYGRIGSFTTSALVTGQLIQVAGATGTSLTVTPSTLVFQSWQGAPAQSQSLQIGGTAGTAWQATAATSSGGAWLSVSPGAGQIPASVVVQVNSDILTPGTYQGSITIQAPEATTLSSTISVTLTVTAASVPSVSFTLYPIPTPSSSPFSITSGPDGALWFTEANGNKIGRIMTAGVITEYAVPTANAYPEGITAGADGALWFTEYLASKIGRITTSGKFTEYAVPSFANPISIAAGSDGALWFTQYYANTVGRISTSGAFTEYPVPTPDAGPWGITAGPDGALWFTEASSGSIGRITTSGNITEYPGSGGGGLITNGPDGALWFTEAQSGVGRISTAGVITLYGGPGGDSGITTGPDGALWVTQFSGTEGVLGRITPTQAISGAITYYNISEPNYPPVNEFSASITTGPDGALWFTDFVPNLIGRASLSSLPTLPPSISPGGIVPVDSTVATIQPGEWVSIYGSNLASSTVTWNGDFPTSLGGTSATINGKSAYLSFVSPTQINLQAPNDTSTGPVSVVVTTASGTSTSTVTLAQFGPSFLLLGSKHVAGIIPRSDGLGAYGGGTYDILGPTGNSLGYPTVAAKAGDIVELYGTGLGPTNPAVAAGQVFSGAAPTTNPVSLRINNVSVTPSFAGLSGAGLYQINLTVPTGLGTGDVPLVATVGGVQTPPNVVISLQ